MAMSRSPARMWMTLLGVVLVLTAILGMTDFYKTLHPMMFHIEGGEMLLHWVLAVLTLGLAFGVKDDLLLGRITIAYGAVYVLVGVVGFFMDTIGSWHVALGDNLLHLALGIISIAAGMASAKQAMA
ncbi:MAG: hypothetical protein QOD77_1689 [Thermoplasmata archaeon]|jgi:hypothetical protein|nr:hypothetical protein [Thermoplasmata archaeon]